MNSPKPALPTKPKPPVSFVPRSVPVDSTQAIINRARPTVRPRTKPLLTKGTSAGPAEIKTATSNLEKQTTFEVKLKRTGIDLK